MEAFSPQDQSSAVIDSNPIEEDLESGEDTGMEINYSTDVTDKNNTERHSSGSGEVSAEETDCLQSEATVNTLAITPVKDVRKNRRKGSLGDDDRSQTPLQDEPDAAVAGTINNQVNSGINSKVAEINLEMKNENHQGDDVRDNGTKHENGETASKILPSTDGAPIGSRRRRTSINEDHVELDYEEEEAVIEEGKIVEREPVPVDGTVQAEKKLEMEDDEPKAVDKEEKEEGEEDDEEEEGEQHSTDGELDDDDDCEEGEIKEAGLKHPFVRPLCRFFTRGNCTWGASCRFLHPGVNDKGNYSMIDQGFPPPGMGPGPGPMFRPPGPWNQEVRVHDRLGKRVIPASKPEGGPLGAEADNANAPPGAGQQAGPPAEPEAESAWERGLRHARELRKRKEGGGPITEEGVPEGEKKPDVPPPAPEIIREPERPPPFVPPPQRDPYYDDVPRPRYDEDDYYNRPPIPPPMHMPMPHEGPWGPPGPPFYRPPFDPHWGPRWGPHDHPNFGPRFGPPHPDFRPPHPDFGHPHGMPPHPDFRMMEMERERMNFNRRLSPPPRMDYFRRDERFDRPGGPPPPRDHLPLPSADHPQRGRGEEWKDPWIRTKSPKRKARSGSSHSGSRPARGSRPPRRSRSKGSYNSFSSSSYSSKSRSRSRSSYSSYSKSSGSSYSSRSSSRSRSRSRGHSRGRRTKKPVVATTLGQSILEKKIKPGDVGKVGVVTSADLPPPITTIKPPTDTAPLSAALELGKATVPTLPLPGRSTASVMPIGAKPIVVPGRGAALQPVGKGVAAVFGDHEDTNEKGQPGFPLKSTLTPLPNKGMPSMPPILMPQLPAGQPPSMVGQPLSAGVLRPGLPQTGPPPRGGVPQAVGPVTYPGLVPTAKGHPSGVDTGKGPVTGAPGVARGRAAFPSGRDPAGGPARRSHSGGSSRSSGGSSRSSYSRSHSSGSSASADSEHLYRDIASPISSASSSSIPRQTPVPSTVKKPPTTPPSAGPPKPAADRSRIDPLKTDGRSRPVGGSSKPDARDVRGVRPEPGRGEHRNPRGELVDVRRELPAAQRGYTREGVKEFKGDVGGAFHMRRPGEPPRDERRMDSRMEPRDGRGEHRDIRGGMDMHRDQRDLRVGGPEPPRGGEHRAPPRGGPGEGDARRESWRGGDAPPPVRGIDREPPRIQDHRRPLPPGESHDYRADQRDGRGDIGRPDHRDRIPPPGGARGMPSHPRAGSGEGDSRRKPSPGARRPAAPPHPSPNKGSDQRSMVAGNQKENMKLTQRSDRGNAPPPVESRKRPAAEPARSSPSKQPRRAPDAAMVRQDKALARPRGPESTRPAPSGKSPSKPAPPSGGGTSGSAAGSRRKSSTSSRREELLMQLKAVEDAIAKKRSKMP